MHALSVAHSYSDTPSSSTYINSINSGTLLLPTDDDDEDDEDGGDDDILYTVFGVIIICHDLESYGYGNTTLVERLINNLKQFGIAIVDITS